MFYTDLITFVQFEARDFHVVSVLKSELRQNERHQASLVQKCGFELIEQLLFQRVQLSEG